MIHRHHKLAKVVNRTGYWEELMADQDVDELVVRLDQGIDLLTMENGIKLVGAAFLNKNMNKWGV